MMQIKKHITAGCFLIRKVNSFQEILLIYKNWSPENQGWVLPKGHIEEGESLDQTAIRETQEETGYQNIKIIKPLKTLNIEYPWTDGTMNHKAIHYYLAELIDDKQALLKLEENEAKTQKEIKWFPLVEASERLLFDDERAIMDIVINEYK